MSVLTGLNNDLRRLLARPGLETADPASRVRSRSPLPEVASRAERVMADLAPAGRAAGEAPEVEAIERELPPVVVRLRERSEETTLGSRRRRR